MRSLITYLTISLIFYTVCAHLPGEYDPNKEPNRPQAIMFTDELLQYYGYPVETHKVHCDDGYINTFFRFQAKGTTIQKGLPVIYF